MHCSVRQLFFFFLSSKALNVIVIQVTQSYLFSPLAPDRSFPYTWMSILGKKQSEPPGSQCMDNSRSFYGEETLARTLESHHLNIFKVKPLFLFFFFSLGYFSYFCIKKSKGKNIFLCLCFMTFPTMTKVLAFISAYYYYNVCSKTKPTDKMRSF